MFNFTTNQFTISNDTEYEVVLFIIADDLIDYSYLSPDAKKLYNTLSQKEKDSLKNFISNN